MTKQTNIPPLRFAEFNDDWEKKKLGEVADYIQPTKYLVSSTEYDNLYKTPVLTAGKTFILGYTNEENGIFENNLPVIIFDDFTTATQFVDFPFKAKSSAMKILIAKKEFNIKFLYEIMQIINYEIGGHERHWISKFTQIEISIPSLPEQTKIAAFLTAVDAKIYALKKKKNLLEAYKKGVMQGIFGNGRDARPCVFTDAEGKPFADWEMKKLGEVGEIVTGKTPSTTDLDLWNGEIQFVTPTDIDENKYQYETQRTIKELSKTKLLPPKSIMFTCIASIGKMSLSIKPCVTNQQINSIIPLKKFDNEFIFYSMLNIVDYIKSTQSTNTLPIINKTEFSKFEINIPKDKKEQTLIANFLSSIDEKINHTQMQITQTEIWKKGLLQRMFV